MLAIGRDECIIRFVKKIQQALVQWNAGAKNGRQHRLLFHHFALSDAEWSLDFCFFEWQHFTDLISSDLTNAFKIAAETHAVFLNFDITQFSYPVCDEAVLFAEVDYHFTDFRLQISDFRFSKT